MVSLDSIRFVDALRASPFAIGNKKFQSFSEYLRHCENAQVLQRSTLKCFRLGAFSALAANSARFHRFFQIPLQRLEEHAETTDRQAESILLYNTLCDIQELFRGLCRTATKVGVLYLGSVRTAYLAEAQQIYITRSSRIPRGGYLEQRLAPSADLFRRFLTDWKSLPTDSWWMSYALDFVFELFVDPEKYAALTEISVALQAGQNLTLCCFCEDPKCCHRHLVGDVFRLVGFRVVETTPLKIPIRTCPLLS